MDLRALLITVAARAATDEDLTELAAAIRPDVAEWRWLPHNADLHDPEPFLAELRGATAGATWPSEQPRNGRRIGLDVHGRPLVEEAPDRHGNLAPAAVWTHGPDFAEERAGRQVRRVAFGADGRVACVAEAAPDRLELRRWSWSVDGARIDEASAAGGEAKPVAARLVRLAADGTVREVLGANEDGQYHPTSDPVAAILEGLGRAATLDATELFWSYRLHGPAPPRPDATNLVAELAGALETAVRTAVDAAAVAEPYVLAVGAGEDLGHLGAHDALPWVEVGSRAFRDRLVATSDDEDAAVRFLFDGFKSGDAARVELAERLDDSAMRSWRAFRSSETHDEPAELERRRAAQHALEVELSRRLNAAPPPDVAEPFLALVEFDLIYDAEAKDGLWRAAESAVGSERVAAFRRTVQGHAGAPPPGDVQNDRDALAALLVHRGLDPAAAGALAREAMVVLDLATPEPGAPAPRSRLGGPPLLPPGETWPADLTFVAALDLSELRAGGLPHEGWALVFSALDPGDVTEGVRVLDVPPGTEPVAAEGPALAPHPIVGRPRLELTGLPEALEPAVEHGYNAVLDELRDRWLARQDEPAPERPRRGLLRRHRPAGPPLGFGHMVGGRAEEAVVLLSLESDDALGFKSYGARALQLRVSREDAAARRWEAVEPADVHNI